MAKDDVEDFIEKMGLAKGNYYIILQDVGNDKFKKIDLSRRQQIINNDEIMKSYDN